MQIQPMTDEQRKAIAIEFFRRVDRGGDVLELFDEKAEFYFPKWGVAHGRGEIAQFLDDLSGILAEISHDMAYANFVQQGDRVVVEATSSGKLKNGTGWRAGTTHAGRWCDVLEIRDFRIQRCFVYLDPDYAGADTERYPWLDGEPTSRY
jgi:ketosteroid isomerase-like protein